MEDLDKADHTLKDSADMVGELHNRKICPVFENGFLWKTGRLETGTQHILDKTKLAILSHKQRLAELIITTEYFVPVLKACLDCKGKALGKDVGSSAASALNGR